MVDYASDVLPKNGYAPYYLYRQRNTLDNLENTGYCKPGTEGLYNVYIMDETHTILACGAGAVSKLCNADGTKIERVYNYKYPYEYLSRFEEMLARKETFDSFYRKYPL
jgi:oxygen-independent coproporphyrinogen-3 oxidase